MAPGASTSRRGKARLASESICHRRLSVVARFDAPSAAQRWVSGRWRGTWSDTRLKHNSNSYGDAVTDDFHTNNDAAISKLEDTVRVLETRHEMLIAKLSNPTEQ